MPRTWHRYARTAAMTASGYVGESPLFLLDYLLRVARVVVLFSVWRVILAGRPETSGMGLESVLTYTLVAEAFSTLLVCQTRIELALWDGAIALCNVRPMSIFGQFMAMTAGRVFMDLALFAAPLLLVAAWLGVNVQPAGPLHGVAFVASLGLAVSVGLAIDFIFAALMVWFNWNVWNASQIRAVVGALLSGAMLPLALLPWGAGDLFGWLPWAAMASAPLRIFTGTGDIVPLLAMQATWSVVLWPVAHHLWARRRERLVAFGG